ncbi:MAG: hypothetical protein K6G88_13875 [Lachnospiraceae bacterium]|nr:hypothetical protein [Lachnospiraceae bacterium]
MIKYKFVRKIICTVAFGFGISLLTFVQDVTACEDWTQADMYNTVKEAVVRTCTESRYDIVLTGENDDVTREDVEGVIKEVAHDYSSEYNVCVTDIKECLGIDLEGYEVSLDVSNLSYIEQVKFHKDVKRLAKSLKRKCKGKSKLKKVSIISNWCKANVAVMPKASNDIYSVFTTRQATKQGLANIRAYLLNKVCGYRTRVVKYNHKHCVLVKLGKKSYIVD